MTGKRLGLCAALIAIPVLSTPVSSQELNSPPLPQPRPEMQPAPAVPTLPPLPEKRPVPDAKSGPASADSVVERADDRTDTPIEDAAKASDKIY